MNTQRAKWRHPTEEEVATAWAKYDRKYRKVVARDYAASLMNETKWIALANAWRDHWWGGPDEEPRWIQWTGTARSILDAEPFPFSTSCADVFYPTHHERGLAYADGDPPFCLRDLEWIEFDDTLLVYRGHPGVPPGTVSQDIEALVRLIEGLGNYPLERTARGVRLVGHLRQPVRP